jgi:hypothetical protein
MPLTVSRSVIFCALLLHSTGYSNATGDNFERKYFERPRNARALNLTCRL